MSACNVGDLGSFPGSPVWEDPLEKEMAIHSSTLAWKIPWTEEPGRLQYIYVCAAHLLYPFILDGNLGYFQVLTTVSSAAMNFGVDVSC